MLADTFGAFLTAPAKMRSLRSVCKYVADGKYAWGNCLSEDKVSLVEAVAPFVSDMFLPSVLHTARFVRLRGGELLDQVLEYIKETDEINDQYLLDLFSKNIELRNSDLNFLQAIMAGSCFWGLVAAAKTDGSKIALASVIIRLSSDRFVFNMLRGTATFSRLTVDGISLFNRSSSSTKKVIWHGIVNYPRVGLNELSGVSGREYFASGDWLRRRRIAGNVVGYASALILYVLASFALVRHVPSFSLAISAVFGLSLFFKVLISWLDDFCGSYMRHPGHPALDLYQIGIDSEVLVVVPVLVVDMAQIARLIEVLRHNVVAANDTNVRFIVYSDLPSVVDLPDREAELNIISELTREISGLNRSLNDSYGSPVSHAHRFRTLCARTGAWRTKGRKVGKLREINRCIVTGVNELDYYHSDSGYDLGRVNYVLVIDEDTRLAPNCVQHLAGIVGHPFNVPVVKNGRLESGVVLAVPAVLTSKESVGGWRLARFWAGPAYSWSQSPPIVEDSRYEYLGATGYKGKGMYDPFFYEALIDGNENVAIALSHDTLEGGLLAPVFVNEAVVYDEFPASIESLWLREVRWAKGDLLNVVLLLRSLFSRRKESRIGVLGGFEILRQWSWVLTAVFLAPLVTIFALIPHDSVRLLVMTLLIVALSEGYFRHLVSTLVSRGAAAAFRASVRSFSDAVVSTLLKLWRSPYSFMAVFVASVSLANMALARGGEVKWVTNYQANSRQATGFLSLFRRILVSAALAVLAVMLAIKWPLMIVVVGMWPLNPWFPYIFNRACLEERA